MNHPLQRIIGFLHFTPLHCLRRSVATAGDGAQFAINIQAWIGYRSCMLMAERLHITEVHSGGLNILSWGSDDLTAGRFRSCFAQFRIVDPFIGGERGLPAALPQGMLALKLPQVLCEECATTGRIEPVESPKSPPLEIADAGKGDCARLSRANHSTAQTGPRPIKSSPTDQ